MSFKPVTVTTTIEPVVTYNPKRKGLALFNNGTVTVFVSQDPSNVASDGFPVAASVAIIFSSEDDDEPELALYAVTESGSADCRVQESIGRAEVNNEAV